MNDATAVRNRELWHVVSRWLQFEGEMRVAMLRVVLVAAFYAAQLSHYLFFADKSDAVENFQRQATYLSGAWLCVSLAVLVLLSRRWLPWGLKYVTVGFDLLLLTAVAALGSGPASPLVYAFTLLVALAGLRGSLRLLLFATLGAMLCYLGLVGLHDDDWFDAVHHTPMIEQMVVLLTLASTGIVVGQLVRMVRQVTSEMLLRQNALKEQAT